MSCFARQRETKPSRFGPRLLEAPTPLFGQYARHRLDCACVERGEGAAEKIAMLEETVKELQANGM